MKILENAKDGSFVIVDDMGICLARTYSSFDAKLFVVAPELLEVLKEAVELLYGAGVMGSATGATGITSRLRPANDNPRLRFLNVISKAEGNQ